MQIPVCEILLRRTLCFLLILVSTAAVSSGCGKGEDSSVEEENQESVEDRDTTLTAEEILSTSLVQGLLGEDNEPELEEFIEVDLYGELKSSKSVTMERVSSSAFLIEFEKDGNMKSYLLKKFYDPQKEDYFFIKSEPNKSDVTSMPK